MVGINQCNFDILLFGMVNGQILVSGLAAAILGACLGFLRYNFQPTQIYMGDAGALFLGFLLAVLGLQQRFPENRISSASPASVLPTRYVTARPRYRKVERRPVKWRRPLLNASS